MRIVPTLSLGLALLGSGAASTEDLALVATRQVERGPYSLTLPERVGTLAPGESQVLAFEVAGRVVELAAEGKAVETGETVARLDDRLESAQLRRAHVMLDDARSVRSRLEALHVSGVASQQALDDARTTLRLRRAEYDVARQQLDRKLLLAPWEGRIVDRLVEPGEVVGPATPIATLMSLATVRLEIGLPGYSIGRVARDQRVLITVPAFPGERFEGLVSRVAPAAREGHHLFEVEIEIQNPAHRLRPGMTARAEIVERALEKTAGIPVRAVVPQNGDRVVFFVVDGRARAVSVANAPLDRGHLLLGGEIPSAELVVRGQHLLHDGVPVRVDNRILDRSPEP